MNKRQKISLVLNSLIFVFTVFAIISTVIGFQFMGELSVLSEKNLKSFRYFTNESNIFAALVSLAFVIFKFTKKGKSCEKLPLPFYILKLAATTGVTLTMLVTICYLAPRSKTTYFAYFMNASFFMHFLTPLLCIISFVFFEPSEKAPFKFSFLGVIPMALYACVYTPNVLLHLQNGKPNPDYDWYGFLAFGLNTIWFVLPFLIIFTWLFSLALWAMNKKAAK